MAWSCIIPGTFSRYQCAGLPRRAEARRQIKSRGLHEAAADARQLGADPMGPAPNTAAVSPGAMEANFMECMATASGSATDASSIDRPAGMGSRLAAGRFTSSRKNPGCPGLLKNRMLAQTL